MQLFLGTFLHLQPSVALVFALQFSIRCAQSDIFAWTLHESEVLVFIPQATSVCRANTGYYLLTTYRGFLFACKLAPVLYLKLHNRIFLCLLVIVYSCALMASCCVSMARKQGCTADVLAFRKMLAGLSSSTFGQFCIQISTVGSLFRQSTKIELCPV